jgi:hypothetical protein
MKRRAALVEFVSPDPIRKAAMEEVEAGTIIGGGPFVEVGAEDTIRVNVGGGRSLRSARYRRKVFFDAARFGAR